MIYNDLKNGFKLPKSQIHNSFELFQKLKDFTIPDNYIFLLLELSSLYNNITLDLTINSLERRARSINNNYFITFNDILYSTKFLFNNTYFVFNDKYYQQHTCLPMGSLIYGLYADMIMEWKIEGVGNTKSVTKGITECMLSSHLYAEYSYPAEAYVCQKLTSYSPRCPKSLCN